MNSKDQDGFRPRRPVSIDGFFANPQVNRPRQPRFRTPTPSLQPTERTIGEMPAESTIGVMHQPANVAAPLQSADNRPRRRPGETPNPHKEHHKKPHRARRFAKRTGVTLGILVLVFGGFFGFKFYRDIAKLTGNANPFSLLGLFHPANLKNQDGRVNILVAGNSADDAGHGGAQLTDSIMVLSLDTRNNSAFMLSIPRDLWVDIPGHGHAKINSAYVDGGMDLLQQVVERSLGIPIHYQTLVNYSAFRDLVNAVGGITITIQSSDPRGIYDPSLDFTTRNCCALAKYPNGAVTLSGKQALNLARARGDAYGSYGFPQADFDRTQHQRQMLMAIKDKAASPSVVANPLKITKLVDAVGGNVKTNLQINEIETLYYYSKNLSDNNIQSVNINTLGGSNTTMLSNYSSPDGQSALIPAAGVDDFSAIQAQMKRLFSRDPLVKEAATVVLLNGTQTGGLASKQRSVLSSKGIDVEMISDAPANQSTTSIIDNSKGEKPNTLASLKSLYGATVVTNQTLTDTYPQADFIVILGQNVIPKQNTSSNQ